MKGSLPDWMLPRGVDRALDAYTRSERLPGEDAAYFWDDPLCRLDLELVGERFGRPELLVDLGCGSGRASLVFAERGCGVTAIDLSHPMLRHLLARARASGLPISCMRANLCDLGAIPDGTFDYAIMLFSTLGMIRGRLGRRTALAEVARVMRPKGMLAVHAHNVLANVRDPQGRRWLAADLWRRLVRSRGAGDRPMTYRGMPNLVVHQYRLGELRTDLRFAGWKVREVLPIRLRAEGATIIGGPYRNARADGWLVFAERS